MVTLSDCSHMEIKKIYNCDIVKIEKKAVCRIDVADINGYTSPKRLHIAISNLYKLMNLFSVDSLKYLIGNEIKCMIHQKSREVTFISPLVFENQTEDDYVYCNQVKILDG